MGLKIAKQLRLLKATNKAKLFLDSKNQKCWVPNSAIVNIRKSGSFTDLIVESWYEGNISFEKISLTELLNQQVPPQWQFLTQIDESEFPADLVHVQQEAVEFAIKLTRCLIWLWTGSGKTKIAIEVANILFRHGKIKRLYWITPQYERMAEQLNIAFKKWLNPLLELRIMSINWFSYYIDESIKPTDCVVIDECHRVKNGIIAINEAPDCQLANNIRLSIQSAGYVYGLTATTCINGILDLFGIFFCIEKSIIIEKGKKAVHYLRTDGEKIKGLKSTLSFLQSVAPYIFHRHRQDYEHKTMIESEHKLFLPASQSALMNALYHKSASFLKKNQSIIDVYIHMIQCCYRSGGAGVKKKKLIEIIKSIPLQDQIIVFGFTVNGKYADTALIRQALAEEHLHSFVELNGERSDQDNALAIHLFRQNKYRILIASYGCGAEALDFPNANHVILFGHSLNPIHRYQGVGRIDRLNQKKQCYAHNIYIHNSVEGYINELYVRKIDLSKDIAYYVNQANTQTLLNNEIS